MLFVVTFALVACQDPCANGHTWEEGFCSVCGEEDPYYVPTEKILTDIPTTTDNYRTYYQIMPYSFADSNGDGIGDIQGIIDKLDYIQSLNFDGLWLTPVHKSGTYHKYDVDDFFSIDAKFGTLEDYDRLIEECHKRGMTVLMDLVINHTSNKHKWFTACSTAHERNTPTNRYYNYYNFREGTASGVWYKSSANGWIYEGQFWSGMPDLNWDEVLDHPDGYLAQDLTEVMRFWLEDHNVDGFRLDAVSQYFTGNTSKNIQVLSWINETAKSIKPDCYIVGEGPWDQTAYNYYQSGADSFFLFNHGYSGGGTIPFAVRMGEASYFATIDTTNKSRISNGIPALFIANHDTSRAYNILSNDVNSIKLGYGMMAMCAGATYWYYGDEIGMASFNGPTGAIDENKRQPIAWGDSYTCKPVAGSTAVADGVKYPLGDVPTNLAQDNSLVNYIARANALRRSFPQIARNYGVSVYLSEDRTVAIVQKGEGADAVYVVLNASSSANTTVALDSLGNFEIVGTLSVDITDMPTLDGAVLNMPCMTIAVLKKV